jgi:DNA-binding MarR family transcriptional regulator
MDGRGVLRCAQTELLISDKPGRGNEERCDEVHRAFRIVDHLERRGLVQRSASAVNRRYYVLYLTGAGTALLSRLRPAIAESEKTLAAKIGPRAFRELQRALSVFLDEP